MTISVIEIECRFQITKKKSNKIILFNQAKVRAKKKQEEEYNEDSIVGIK